VVLVVVVVVVEMENENRDEKGMKVREEAVNSKNQTI
jgi:hypothetical protein